MAERRGLQRSLWGSWVVRADVHEIIWRRYSWGRSWPMRQWLFGAARLAGYLIRNRRRMVSRRGRRMFRARREVLDSGNALEFTSYAKAAYSAAVLSAKVH